VGAAAGTIQVNGEARALDVRDVAELVERLGLGGDRGGIAVAVNGELVRRRAWGERALRPGDEVEIVGAVQGG
jgi:sulfur carrier protein